MTLFLTDIASYQSGLTLGNIKPDCIGVFVKATEGTYYVDPYYAAWKAQADAAGLIFAAYHYVTTEDPQAQVNHIADNIGDKSVPLMFDVEANSGDVNQTLNIVKAAHGAGLNPRVTYLPMWYWEQIGRPDLRPLGNLTALTASAYPSTASGSAAALYPGDNAAGWNPYGGVTPTFYQFTDAAVLGGQKVDMNAYRGTAEQLAAVLGLTTAVPASDNIPFPGATLVYVNGQPDMYSDEVRVWQNRMRQRGWAITVDGYYGPQSLSFCVAFQRDSNAHGWPLAVDGKVGPHTWYATFNRPVS